MQEGERQRFGKSTGWIGGRFSRWILIRILIPKVLFWEEKLGQSQMCVQSKLLIA